MSSRLVPFGVVKRGLAIRGKSCFRGLCKFCIWANSETNRATSEDRPERNRMQYVVLRVSTVG
eukprot:10337760-Lingulodinium_polyedra.AAC.1